MRRHENVKDGTHDRYYQMGVIKISTFRPFPTNGREDERPKFE